MTEEQYNSALASLQRSCVKREHCRQEIYRKALKVSEGDPETAQKMVDSLVEDRFVDDARYAAAFAREKASLSGWGRVKISYTLRGKGVSREDIDAALQEVDEGAAGERLEKLLRGKWAVLQEDPYGKFKLIKYALTRGYEYNDELTELVEKIIKGL
jgi:regulatory protein